MIAAFIRQSMPFVIKILLGSNFTDSMIGLFSVHWSDLAFEYFYFPAGSGGRGPPTLPVAALLSAQSDCAG